MEESPVVGFNRDSINESILETAKFVETPEIALDFLYSRMTSVPGETQMCRDLFKDAGVSVLPPNSASPCVSVRLDSGRLQNSLVLTLSINRSSEECTVPTNFVVTLQVIDGSGYPVGDLWKSLSAYESLDKSQLAYSEFPSLPTPIFQPSKVQNIPCFRHTKDKRDNPQDVTNLGPTIGLIEFSPEQQKAQSFASRVVWTFSRGNENSPSAPHQLAARGELVDKENNKLIQFVSLNQVTFNYSDGCVGSPDSPECSQKQKTIEAVRSPRVAAGHIKSFRSKRAASNTSNVTQPVCRNLKHRFPRLLETPESLECLTLDAYASFSVNNAVFVALTYQKNCPQWKTGEWVLHAYNEKGFPAGTLNKEDSFIHYTEAGDSQRFKCDTSKVATFVKRLDFGKNLQYCQSTGGNEEEWLEGGIDGNAPSLFHAQSKEFYNAGGNVGVFFIWQFLNPTSNHSSPKRIRFVAEAFIPSQRKVLILRSRHEIHLDFVPLSEQPTPIPSKSCFSEDNSPTIGRGGPVTLIPIPRYTQADCNTRNSNSSTPCELTTTSVCQEIPEICYEHTDSTTPTTQRKTTVNGQTTEPNRIPVVIVGKPPPPTLPPLKIKRLRKTDVYEGCDDKKKGCIVPQKGSTAKECFKSKSCELIIAFQRQDILSTDDVVVIEMYHRDPGEWFAIGLNPTQPRMAGAYVLECVDEGHREGPVIYNSYNTAGSEYANQRYYEDGPEGAKLIITPQETYRRGHEIYCRFHIKVQFFRRTRNNEKVFFDLNRKSFFVIAAWGNDQIAGPRGNLIKHDPKHFMRPEDKPRSKTILGARYAPNFKQSPLIIAHGVLMTWAFVFCIPIGIFTARFFKETFPNFKLFKRFPLWLVIHVVSMTLAVMLFLISMINEIQGHSGWVSQRYSYFHTNFGGILSGLFVLNFAFGFFVKVSKHGQEFTNPAETAHGLLGHFVCLAGFVVILKMDDVSFGNAPCQAKWIVGGLIFSYCVLHGVLTYHYFWVDWVVGLKKGRGYVILPIGVLTERYVNSLLKSRKSRFVNTRTQLQLNSDEVIEAPGAKVRLWALIMLILLGFMYSCWTHITIVFNEPQRPCVPLDQYEG